MGPICPPSFFQENAVEVGKACCSLVSTYQGMKNKLGKVKKLTAKTVVVNDLKKAGMVSRNIVLKKQYTL